MMNCHEIFGKTRVQQTLGARFSCLLMKTAVSKTRSLEERPVSILGEENKFLGTKTEL